MNYYVYRNPNGDTFEVAAIQENDFDKKPQPSASHDPQPKHLRPDHRKAFKQPRSNRLQDNREKSNSMVQRLKNFAEEPQR